DHLAVDLHHHRAPHDPVLEDAPQHATVAGADNEYAVGGAVCQQRHVGQHLLIDELVALRDLDHAVQHHDPAVREALEHGDVLERTLHPREFALHQEALTPVRVQRLVDPAVGCHDATRAAPAAARTAGWTSARTRPSAPAASGTDYTPHK